MFRNDSHKMSPFKTAKFKSQINHQRTRSPNRSFAVKSNNNSSTTSFHSDQLMGSLDQVEIFPSYYIELIKSEERNINWFKSQINKEKQRVSLQIQALSVEIMHIMEDYKLSLIAILDRIYQNYISKYAEFKTEIMEINRIQDQILMQVNVKADNLHSPSRNNKISNDYTVKTMQSHRNQLKKLKILDYISEIQRQKSLPLAEKSQYIIIMTQYENGFFQLDQYKQIMAKTKSKIKLQFRDMIQNAYVYIRNPDAIIAKQCTANKAAQRKIERQNYLLGNGNDQDSVNLTENFKKNQIQYGRRKRDPLVHQIDQFYPNFNNQIHKPESDSFLSKKPPQFHQPHFYHHPQAIVSPTKNRITSQLLKLNPRNSFKSVSTDIILCCLYLQQGLIATGNKDGSLVFYDERGNVIKIHPKEHKSSVCSLGLINDGQYLASGSDYPNSQIILWNLNTLQPVCSFKEHKAAVTAIACLRDKQHMISGSYDKKLCIYSFHEQKLKYTLPSNKSSVTAICLNSDGTKLISCGLQDKMLNIWQIVKKQKVQTLFLEQIIENSTMICSVVSSAVQNNLIYIGSKDGRVKIVDIDKGQAIKSMNVCNNALIQMIVYEQQGPPIILGWPCKQKCLKVIDCQNGKVLSMPTKSMLEFSCGVGPKATVNKDGSVIVVGSQSEDRQISFFKLQKNM